MSYNVDTITIVSQSDFRLPLDALAELQAGERPESSLLEEDPWGSPPIFEDRDGFRYFRGVHWGGEGSGGTWEIFLEEVLPATLGSADLVVCFEGGDSYQGIRVVDGVVTEHKVVMTLGEQT